MSLPKRYVPETEGLNKDFFRLAGGGTLHLQRCDSCLHFRFPPRNYCHRCHSGNWSWVPSPGCGTIASWVTTHFTVDPGWVDQVPYTTGVVQLEEGPRLLGALRGIELHDLHIGLPVVLRSEQMTEDFVFFWVEGC